MKALILKSIKKQFKRLSQIRFCKKILGIFFCRDASDIDIHKERRKKITTNFVAKGRICDSLFNHKKGRIVFGLLPFFLFVISCALSDLSQYGRVVPQNTSNRNSFVFSVSEEYLADNSGSKQDEKYSKMTEAEAKLLIKILKRQHYCYNKDSKLAFKINSRQEKIYDMTFSHLIEQNYRARPIAPRMYYGECIPN